MLENRVLAPHAALAVSRACLRAHARRASEHTRVAPTRDAARDDMRHQLLSRTCD